MTPPTTPEQPGMPPSMAAATADLERLQELLRRAGQGQADLREVQESLSNYWRDHHQVLAEEASVLGEQVRNQMLTELCKWRTQLGQQLPNSNVSRPNDSDHTMNQGDLDGN